MELKRVSFKVAKAIKDNGYPQIFVDCAYYEDNNLHHTEDPYNNCRTIIAYAPTYLEVWLWLWKEKNIKFSVEPNDDLSECYTTDIGYLISEFGDDPEEAIVSAIEYLVDNDLIK